MQTLLHHNHHTFGFMFDPKAKYQTVPALGSSPGADAKDTLPLSAWALTFTEGIRLARGKGCCSLATRSTMGNWCVHINWKNRKAFLACQRTNTHRPAQRVFRIAR
eukprot:1152256-Pelagomonas_calceolata.AAC.6